MLNEFFRILGIKPSGSDLAAFHAGKKFRFDSESTRKLALVTTLSPACLARLVLHGLGRVWPRWTEFLKQPSILLLKGQLFCFALLRPIFPISSRK
jgi:hypothetical protein